MNKEIKKDIKKLLLTGLILLYCGSLRAEQARSVYGGQAIPRGEKYSTESIFYSSSTCASTPTGASTIISNSASSELFIISITSAGSVDSFFQVFDGSGSLSGLGIGSTSTSRIASQYVSAASVRDVRYNLLVTSGILVNVGGVILPCLDIKYTSK